MKKIFYILTMLLISISVNAQTYYISPSGNDAANGSIATPWKTLSKATSAVSSGTIFVKTGTYVETNTSYLKPAVTIQGESLTGSVIKGGMSDAWSTLLELQSPDGTSGNQQIYNLTLDGQYVTGNPKAWVGIWVTGRSNVLIHDCIIKNFKQSGTIFNGTNTDHAGGLAGSNSWARGNKFYNNTVTNSDDMYNGTGQGALMIGFQKGMEIYSNNISQTQRPNFENGWPIKYWNQGWLKGVKIYNNILTKIPYSGTYPGDSGNWDFAIEFFNIEGLEIYGNTIQGAIDMAYNYKGPYPYCAWIHDNKITHQVPGTKVEGAIIFEYRTEGAIVENNIINNKAYGVSFNTRGVAENGDDRYYLPSGVPIGGYSYVLDCTIRNNLFTGMYEGDGIGNSFAIGVISDGPEDPQIKNLKILNNTIVANAGDPVRIGIDLSSMPNGKGNDIFIQNNIVQGAKYGWLQGSNGRTSIAGITVTNNDAYQNGSNTPVWPAGNPASYTNSGNVSVNPGFDANYNSSLAGIGYSSGSTPPPPPAAACVYTYSAWSACVNGQQTRMVTSSPPGCTGTPGPLVQSCTPPPVKSLLFTIHVYKSSTGVYSISKAVKIDNTKTLITNIRVYSDGTFD